jgi:hypothetical protein
MRDTVELGARERKDAAPMGEDSLIDDELFDDEDRFEAVDDTSLPEQEPEGQDEPEG